MLVRLEVPLQLLNISGQQRYLYFRGACVALAYLVYSFTISALRSAFKAMLISSRFNLPQVVHLPFVSTK